MKRNGTMVALLIAISLLVLFGFASEDDQSFGASADLSPDGIVDTVAGGWWSSKVVETVAGGWWSTGSGDMLQGGWWSTQGGGASAEGYDSWAG